MKKSNVSFGYLIIRNEERNNTYLKPSEEGKILIFLNNATPRAKSVSLSSGGSRSYAYLSLKLSVDGNDDLEILANAHALSEKIIEPALNSILSEIKFELNRIESK